MTFPEVRLPFSYSAPGFSPSWGLGNPSDCPSLNWSVQLTKEYVNWAPLMFYVISFFCKQVHKVQIHGVDFLKININYLSLILF